MTDPEAALWAPPATTAEHEPHALETLKAVPLFQDLRQTDLKRVLRLVHERTYNPGEVVFREGDSGAGVFIIKHGAVNIVTRLADASERLIAALSDKQFFGEMALLEDAPRSATAVATVRTELIGFFQPDLESLIERDSRLGSRICWNLARLMASRLRSMNETLKAQRQLPAVQMVR